MFCSHEPHKGKFTGITAHSRLQNAELKKVNYGFQG